MLEDNIRNEVEAMKNSHTVAEIAREVLTSWND